MKSNPLIQRLDFQAHWMGTIAEKLGVIDAVIKILEWKRKPKDVTDVKEVLSLIRVRLSDIMKVSREKLSDFVPRIVALEKRFK